MSDHKKDLYNFAIQLEAGIWGDDTLRLSFEDWLHGKDASLILHPDGTISLVVGIDDPTPVANLYDAILGVLRRHKADYDAYSGHGRI